MNQKIKIVLFELISALMFTSCTSVYQVFETNSNDTKLKNNIYLHENNDLNISYNFWAEGGKVAFKINNKTESPIYIDWDKSHFISNGISFEYWYDVEETNSFNSSETSNNSKTIITNDIINVLEGNTVGLSQINSSVIGKNASQSLTFKTRPKKNIQIPAKSSIIVSKFSINKTPYFDCDFNLKNTILKSPKSKTFTKDDSPLLFRNYLTYYTNDSFEQAKSIDNEFFISSISFLSRKSFVGKDSTYQDCDIYGNIIYRHYHKQPQKKSSSFYLIIK